MKLWEYPFSISEKARAISDMIDSRKAWVDAQADEGLCEELLVGQFDALAKLVRDWQDCYLISRSPTSEVPE